MNPYTPMQTGGCAAATAPPARTCMTMGLTPYQRTVLGWSRGKRCGMHGTPLRWIFEPSQCVGPLIFRRNQAMNKRNSLFAIAVMLALALAALQPIPALAAAHAGQPAPGATFTSAGKTIPLTTYRGHKTMVWLFSTWCPSCSAGLAALAKEQAALEAGGV
ncbi:MAG: redoxin domain-containing protein, partial [Rhodanobacteraceae bacterium]